MIRVQPQVNPVPFSNQGIRLTGAVQSSWAREVMEELSRNDGTLSDRVDAILDKLGLDGWLALCQFETE